MFLKRIKSFFSIINTDAIIFLGVRVGGIVLGITSIVILFRAVSIQQHFDTDGKGLMFDMLPLGPLAYSLAWSVASLVLPGCQRKYHPALDMGLDFLGWVFSFAAGGALFFWSMEDQYEVEFCKANVEKSHCDEVAPQLTTTEQSGAILLIMTGITHLVMFVRACVAVHVRRKKYVPSRNSFMQLEKGSDRRVDVIQVDMVSDQHRQKQNENDRQLSVDSAGTSNV